MIVNGSELAKSENYGCDHEHLVGRSGGLFVVSTKSSEVFKSCECPLYHPSFLGWDKLSRVI